MKLIRYILSHGLLLGILVAIGFGYYYRARLFSDEVNQRIDLTVNAAMEKTRGITEVFQAGKKQDDAGPVTNTESEPAQVSVTPVIPAEPPMETSRAETSDAAVVEQQGTVQHETSTPTEVASINENTAESVAEDKQALPAPETSEAEAIQQAGNNEPEVADSDQQAAAKPQAVLIGEARQAFQAGDPGKAIVLYQELSELNPGNPNVFGELGNVYYSLGKWKQAGSAYFEAASLLLDQGHTRQVQYLYRVIQGLDQESAEKLKARMNM